MLVLDNKSETCVIVLHEIYGVNQHIKGVCEILSSYQFDVICPDLLGRGMVYDYAQEKEAYQNFMEHAGITDGLHKVRELLADIQHKYTKIFILGFSVGATIAWLCSEEECVDGVVGYYGSRIREYTGIRPACPVLLYFAKMEKSFNVYELAPKLSQTNADVHICDGRHGFSDPYSSAYNEELAGRAFNKTLHFLQNS
ncbi:hypothetical protein SporoP37_02230 [Sporosarcina sp. P37]|uniref:dienelactone hydrolase family protein n=1 Tax=unclassified Sporosarcina TaxID=2647733 RepID=UPI000A17BCE8|nr:MULTISPECIES: dienelactone hydrolase family protein [unclassified Sporosarcina]ARK23624.1 hypothetical protein SporoP37_02230 [Sporosarcina sp. P37]PID18753.1 hypothetical protein CSV62_06520 [Sporosarcina sp. P35]